MLGGGHATAADEHCDRGRHKRCASDARRSSLPVRRRWQHAYREEQTLLRRDERVDARLLAPRTPAMQPPREPPCPRTQHSLHDDSGGESTRKQGSNHARAELGGPIRRIGKLRRVWQRGLRRHARVEAAQRRSGCVRQRVSESDNAKSLRCGGALTAVTPSGRSFPRRP
jgi:hypothetical protein